MERPSLLSGAVDAGKAPPTDCGAGLPPRAVERRRMLICLLPLALAAPLRRAAAATSPARIGWLKIQGRQDTPGQIQAFREGMRALGMEEGRDYVLEERYADGDESRLRGLARELIAAGVVVIVATSQPSIAAAASVTKTIPVIGRMVDEPVANGLAHSLARPGGNVTGIYTMTEDMNPKRLALLKEAAPSVSRVGILLRTDFPNPKNADRAWQVAVAAAQHLHVELLALNASSAETVTAAFEQASTKHAQGIITFRNPTVVTYTKLIAELCRRYRFPAVFDAREYVEAGGLMSYGPNIDSTYRQLAGYAVKLMAGTPPGDIPIEQPVIFELVINKRTADAVGVKLPEELLARADDIIE